MKGTWTSWCGSERALIRGLAGFLELHTAQFWPRHITAVSPIEGAALCTYLSESIAFKILKCHTYIYTNSDVMLF